MMEQTDMNSALLKLGEICEFLLMLASRFLQMEVSIQAPTRLDVTPWWGTLTTGAWVLEIDVSHDHGIAFLAELLAIELGLIHTRNIGYRDVTRALDFLRTVEVLQVHVDVSTF